MKLVDYSYFSLDETVCCHSLPTVSHTLEISSPPNLVDIFNGINALVIFVFKLKALTSSAQDIFFMELSF